MANCLTLANTNTPSKMSRLNGVKAEAVFKVTLIFIQLGSILEERDLYFLCIYLEKACSAEESVWGVGVVLSFSLP